MSAFGIVPVWVLQSNISHQAVRVFAAIASFKDAQHECWPAIKKICERAKMSRSRVYVALKQLKDIGAIQVFERYDDEGGRQTSSIFRLIMDDPNYEPPKNTKRDMKGHNGGPALSQKRDTPRPSRWDAPPSQQVGHHEETSTKRPIEQTPSSPPQGDGSLFDESGHDPVPESKPHHPAPSPHKRAEEVRKLWAEMMPASIPTPKIINDTRARAVAAREKDLKKLGIAWYQFFQMITASNFLMGAESSPNGIPFKATFDWVMKPTNFAKIIDGNYKNRPRPANYGGSYVNPESGTGGVL